MKPEITFITLGVSDLERSLTFYRDGLGLETQGIVGQEFEGGAVVFFKMKGGLTLALFPREELARDASVPVTPASPTEFSLAHNVETKKAVDALMAEAEAAGAKITHPPSQRDWGGYSGYFQDPDGHLWEVAWIPPAMRQP